MMNHSLLIKPNHIGIVNNLPQFYRDLAALKFYGLLKDAHDKQWNNDLIKLLSNLDFKMTHPIFRRLAHNPLLTKTCIMELAKMPKEVDRALFVSGLGSPDKNFQAICARALNEIGRLQNLTNCWLFSG